MKTSLHFVDNWTKIIQGHKRNFRKIRNILIIALLITGFAGCGKKEESQIKNVKKKELLIYCGITMIRPMTEIAKKIEKQENCSITITKGGSGNLLKSIRFNKTGDLYLPGSDKYYDIIKNEVPDLITKTVFVGHNKAAIMVQKGNPKNISSDLNNLTDKNFGVVIGNPDSGSIGKTTKKILEKYGIFKEVIKNTITLTTDSKDMVKALKSKKADIVVNWYAVSTWDENPDFIDVIEIDPEYSMTKKLILGLLKYSKYPKIAKKFMKLAGSDEGREIFKKNGLYFEK